MIEAGPYIPEIEAPPMGGEGALVSTFDFGSPSHHSPEFQEGDHTWHPIYNAPGEPIPSEISYGLDAAQAGFQITGSMPYTPEAPGHPQAYEFASPQWAGYQGYQTPIPLALEGPPPPYSPGEYGTPGPYPLFDEHGQEIQIPYNIFYQASQNPEFQALMPPAPPGYGLTREEVRGQDTQAYPPQTFPVYLQTDSPAQLQEPPRKMACRDPPGSGMEVENRPDPQGEGYTPSGWTREDLAKHEPPPAIFSDTPSGWGPPPPQEQPAAPQVPSSSFPSVPTIAMSSDSHPLGPQLGILNQKCQNMARDLESMRVGVQQLSGLVRESLTLPIDPLYHQLNYLQAEYGEIKDTITAIRAESAAFRPHLENLSKQFKTFAVTSQNPDSPETVRILTDLQSRLDEQYVTQLALPSLINSEVQKRWGEFAMKFESKWASFTSQLSDQIQSLRGEQDHITRQAIPEAMRVNATRTGLALKRLEDFAGAQHQKSGQLEKIMEALQIRFHQLEGAVLRQEETIQQGIGKIATDMDAIKKDTASNPPDLSGITIRLGRIENYLPFWKASVQEEMNQQKTMLRHILSKFPEPTVAKGSTGPHEKPGPPSIPQFSAETSRVPSRERIVRSAPQSDSVLRPEPRVGRAGGKGLGVATAGLGGGQTDRTGSSRGLPTRRGPSLNKTVYIHETPRMVSPDQFSGTEGSDGPIRETAPILATRAHTTAGRQARQPQHQAGRSTSTSPAGSEQITGPQPHPHQARPGIMATLAHPHPTHNRPLPTAEIQVGPQHSQNLCVGPPEPINPTQTSTPTIMLPTTLHSVTTLMAPTTHHSAPTYTAPTTLHSDPTLWHPPPIIQLPLLCHQPPFTQIQLLWHPPPIIQFLHLWH